MLLINFNFLLMDKKYALYINYTEHNMRRKLIRGVSIHRKASKGIQNPLVISLRITLLYVEL